MIYFPGGSHSGSSGRSTPSGSVGASGALPSQPGAPQLGALTVPGAGLPSGLPVPVAADPAPGKLFVGGLSWQTSSEKLREYFGMFGSVTDVLIMKDPVTQVNRRTTECHEQEIENVKEYTSQVMDDPIRIERVCKERH